MYYEILKCVSNHKKARYMGSCYELSFMAQRITIIIDTLDTDAKILETPMMARARAIECEGV